MSELNQIDEVLNDSYRSDPEVRTPRRISSADSAGEYSVVTLCLLFFFFILSLPPLPYIVRHCFHFEGTRRKDCWMDKDLRQLTKVSIHTSYH